MRLMRLMRPIRPMRPMREERAITLLLLRPALLYNPNSEDANDVS